MTWVTSAWRRLLVHYHESMIAFWESSIATARHEHDWNALDHALTMRDRHERAVDRLADQQQAAR